MVFIYTFSHLWMYLLIFKYRVYRISLFFFFTIRGKLTVFHVNNIHNKEVKNL